MLVDLSGEKRPRFHRSLLARIALMLVVLVIATSAALFFGIEHFISKQFSELRSERQNRLADLVRQTVVDEKQKLQGITQLLVNDTDLRNSTYYHLYLAGEQVHPQAAVDRMANAFRLETISLWNSDWHLIAGQNNANRPLIESEANAIVSYRENAWIVATARMERDSVLLGYLQIAQPLAQLLSQRFGPDDKILVSLSESSSSQTGALRIPVDEAGQVILEIIASDPVASALSEVKDLLSTVLLIAGIVMTIAFVFFLHWQLQPLSILHRAAEALGQGDFSVRIEPQGSLEMAGLITTFNRMAERLRQMRSMERQLQHQEQLSAIGRVAARVAHNINNPLTVIHNLARLMQGQNDNSQYQEDVKTIIHHSKRAVQTVEQLLHYGRPVQPRQERKGLSTLCHGICDRWLSHHTTAYLEYINAQCDSIVDVDPLQFEEVLENLLDNAYEADPEKKILLEFGQDKERAWLKVKDQGSGFTDEAKRHLFEPFFTTKPEGSGLGLASALAIVRAHGGDLLPGKGPGGELILYLPLGMGAMMSTLQ